MTTVEELAERVAVLEGAAARRSTDTPPARREVPRVTDGMAQRSPDDYPYIHIDGKPVYQHTDIEPDALASLQRWFDEHWPAPAPTPAGEIVRFSGEWSDKDVTQVVAERDALAARVRDLEEQLDKVAREHPYEECRKREVAERFLQRLASEAGTIVSSNDCTPAEIAVARACERFYVDDRAYGYVHRPRKPASRGLGVAVSDDVRASLGKRSGGPPGAGETFWRDASPDHVSESLSTARILELQRLIAGGVPCEACYSGGSPLDAGYHECLAEVVATDGRVLCADCAAGRHANVARVEKTSGTQSDRTQRTTGTGVPGSEAWGGATSRGADGPKSPAPSAAGVEVSEAPYWLGEPERSIAERLAHAGLATKGADAQVVRDVAAILSRLVADARREALRAAETTCSDYGAEFCNDGETGGHCNSLACHAAAVCSARIRALDAPGKGGA